MKPYRVAIAGCGPAGLATALMLHRQGHSVVIFDRFAEPRPVGSGLMLQPTGLAVLKNLGLGNAVSAVGSPISRLSGRNANTGRKVLDVRYSWLGRPSITALGIHRAALFDVLFDAIRREGIAIFSGHQIHGTGLKGNLRFLSFSDQADSEPFDLVVDCAGMRSPLADLRGRDLAYGALWATVEWPEQAGFDDLALEQRYLRASIMVGMMPTGVRSGRKLGTFFWSMKAGQLNAWKSRPLVEWKETVRNIWPATETVLDQLNDHEQLSFAHYAHRTLPMPVELRLFHLGDAWHSTSPQLGQGANMALLDAFALAKAIDEASDLDSALQQASKLRRAHVRLYQALSLTLTPFYQSDSRVLPMIRDLLVPHVAKIWPATWIQAAMVSGLLGSPLDKLGLKPC